MLPAICVCACYELCCGVRTSLTSFYATRILAPHPNRTVAVQLESSLKALPTPPAYPEFPNTQSLDPVHAQSPGSLNTSVAVSNHTHPHTNLLTCIIFCVHSWATSPPTSGLPLGGTPTAGTAVPRLAPRRTRRSPTLAPSARSTVGKRARAPRPCPAAAATPAAE